MKEPEAKEPENKEAESVKRNHSAWVTCTLLVQFLLASTAAVFILLVAQEPTKELHVHYHKVNRIYSLTRELQHYFNEGIRLARSFTQFGEHRHYYQ